MARKDEGTVEAQVDRVAQQTRHQEYHSPKEHNKNPLRGLWMAWFGPGILRCLEPVERSQRRGCMPCLRLTMLFQRIDGPPLCYPYIPELRARSHLRQGRPHIANSGSWEPTVPTHGPSC